MIKANDKDYERFFNQISCDIIHSHRRCFLTLTLKKRVDLNESSFASITKERALSNLSLAIRKTENTILRYSTKRIEGIVAYEVGSFDNRPHFHLALNIPGRMSRKHFKKHFIRNWNRMDFAYKELSWKTMSMGYVVKQKTKSDYKGDIFVLPLQ